MNRIFSYKTILILTFLYLQSIYLKILPEELKVFPEQKGDLLFCPNGKALNKKSIPALPDLKYTNEQKPNYWTRSYHWKIRGERDFNKWEAFNSEIIIYDGYLNEKTIIGLMTSFLDNTNIPTSYKSKEIFLEKENSYHKGYQYITYIFKNNAGKNLTLKQVLDSSLITHNDTFSGELKIKTDNGIEFTSKESRVDTLATIYCDKNNSLVFKDIQQVVLPSSTNEEGKIIFKTMFWVRELRFKTFKTNMLDKKESTFDL